LAQLDAISAGAAAVGYAAGLIWEQGGRGRGLRASVGDFDLVVGYAVECRGVDSGGEANLEASSEIDDIREFRPGAGCERLEG
jgi:hypothetical protein